MLLKKVENATPCQCTGYNGNPRYIERVRTASRVAVRIGLATNRSYLQSDIVPGIHVRTVLVSLIFFFARQDDETSRTLACLRAFLARCEYEQSFALVALYRNIPKKCCLYKCSYLTCWSARLQPAAGASSGLVSRVFLFFLRVFTTYFAHFSVTTGFDFQRTSRSIVVAPSHAFRWHFDLLHCFCSYICYRFVFCTMVYMSYASIRVLLVIYIYSFWRVGKSWNVFVCFWVVEFCFFCNLTLSGASFPPPFCGLPQLPVMHALLG